MSRSRHMKKAKGGAAVYAGAGSNVLKEAEERKRGGKVEHHGEGEEGKKHHDRKERKRGGGVHHHGHPKHHSDGGEAHHKAMHRKQGGGVGANRMPLSTAANIKEVTKGESKEDMGKH
jgi:hypothetical protein